MIDIVDTTLIRKCFAGTYIVKNGSEVALIEVSSSHGVAPILNRLKQLNIEPFQVKYIFITHIHLDHASGVGKLLTKLPNAKLVLHPSGSRHMIDPSKLIEGAIAVYGEEIVKRDYGEILPVDKNRVIECKDGEIFKLGDSSLTTIYTPGHARHHISIYESKREGIFTGDSLGLSYPELTVKDRRFYQPTTTPTAFEYDKMVESIEKMMKYNPKKIYFTHYGVSNEPEEVTRQILKRLKEYRELVYSLDQPKDMVAELREKLKRYYIDEVKNHGTKLSDSEIIELFDIDIKLNAMGLALWFQRL